MSNDSHKRALAEIRTRAITHGIVGGLILLAVMEWLLW